MKFTILTLFPQIIKPYFENSIMKNAIAKGAVTYEIINFRDYTTDNYHKCDDSPYGGGAGQVLLYEPLSKALNNIVSNAEKAPYIIYPSPSGNLWTEEKAKKLKEESEIVFICGRYEGVDQRIIDKYVSEEVCIGDYVLSSGEIASMVIIDSIYRLLDGVLAQESLTEESFNNGLLEYPQWTHPYECDNMKVPSVLLSGNYKEIRKWRLKESIKRTIQKSPNTIEKALIEGKLTHEVKKIIKEIIRDN